MAGPTVAPISPFTDAEELVIRLLVDGLTPAKIARRTGLSPHTVKSHLKHINLKLPGDRPLAQRVVLWAAGYGETYLYVSLP